MPPAPLRIQLISHASVLIESGDIGIWTDPWLFGKAFNESWSLLPPAAYTEAILDRVKYLWISHEHPDHFHVPTLRSLPKEFKQRVRILFQKNNSDKMFAALRRFGFEHFRSLPHRKIVNLEPGLRIYCYQVGHMDSMLGVLTERNTLLNVNDAEINTPDCRRVVADIGRCDTLLNQFSIAGYEGFADRDARLPRDAAGVIRTMLTNHRDLGAAVTIPFASFVYFSCEDNRYINKYANSVADVARKFKEENCTLAVLYPGDSYIAGEAFENSSALGRFEASTSELATAAYDVSPPVPVATVRTQFKELCKSLADRYPRWILRRLRPFVVRIPDLGVTIRFSISQAAADETQDEPDLEINSQPLSFGFANSYGIQTLGVSARYTLYRNFDNWRRHRILFAMNNAEVYLRPKYMLHPRNFTWLASRLAGGTNQIVYRLSRMQKA